jgi:hypothetical protein
MSSAASPVSYRRSIIWTGWHDACASKNQIKFKPSMIARWYLSAQCLLSPAVDNCKSDRRYSRAVAGSKSRCNASSVHLSIGRQRAMLRRICICTRQPAVVTSAPANTSVPSTSVQVWLVSRCKSSVPGVTQKPGQRARIDYPSFVRPAARPVRNAWSREHQNARELPVAV